MIDSVDELIREVAAKHGTPLTMDDPLAILMTVNDRLISNFQLTLREELSKSSNEWSEEARNKAEKVLNAALETGRESALDILHSGVDGLPDIVSKTIREELSNQLSPILQRTNRLARFNAITLAATGCAILALLLISLF